MKILREIGNFYKYMFQKMGKMIYLFLAILGFGLYTTIKEAYWYGDVLPMYVTIGLVVVYHIMFFVDKRKKDKKK